MYDDFVYISVHYLLKLDFEYDHKLVLEFKIALLIALLVEYVTTTVINITGNEFSLHLLLYFSRSDTLT